MNSYLARLGNVFFAIEGTSAALAYWTARRKHGPGLQLVDWSPITLRPFKGPVLNTRVPASKDEECNECGLYVSRCFCA
jgi:hypothetical protein